MEERSYDEMMLAHVALTQVPRLNSVAYRLLFERCGGVTGFFRERNEVIGMLLREAHLESVKPERETWLEMGRRELEWMERNGVRCCFVEEGDYPYLLKQCPDAPVTLYYKGTLDDGGMPRLAVVGTRRASDRVKAKVEHWVEELVQEGYRFTLVSGLAYGIDITGHVAALHQGLRTWAVLGHGLNTVYPAAHKRYAEKIVAEGGALVTEFSSQSAIYPQNFLQRNRIVAGLCQGVLVAESAVRGGAMSTARMAFSYGREVLAIPGRPEDEHSTGCNQLIKQNVAALVENAGDVVAAMGWTPERQGPVQQTLDLFPASAEEDAVRQALAAEPLDADELHRRTGVPVAELSVVLLNLEMAGVVAALPGNRYMLNR